MLKRAVQRRNPLDRGVPFSGSAAIVLALLLSITGALYWLVSRRERADGREVVSANALALATSVEQRVVGETKALQRMVRQWEFSGAPTKAAWEADASQLYRDSHIYQAIEWINPDLQIEWLMPVKGNESALGLKLGFEKRRADALSAARDQGVSTASRPIHLVQGGDGFLVYVPIHRNGQFAGLIAGVIRFDRLVLSLPPEFQENYAITIGEGGALIYSQGAIQPDLDTRWGRGAVTQFLNQKWQVRLVPTPQTAARFSSALPAVVLFSGLAFSLFSFVILSLLAYVRSKAQATRTILASITDAFLCLDSNWRFVSVNPAAQKILGRSESDLLGKNVWEEYPEAVQTSWFSEYHRAVRDQVDVSFEIYNPHSQKFHAVRAFPSKDGLNVYFRDVTAEKAAIEAVQASEAALNAAQQVARVGSWDLNLETGESNWSRQMFVMCGLDPSAKPLSSEEWLRNIHPIDKPEVELFFHRATSEFEEGYSSRIEFRYQTGGEGYLYLLTSVETYKRDGARIMCGTCLDVTESVLTRKKLERSERILEAQQKELEEAIGELGLLASTDGLTGLSNRRAFEANLAREFDRSRGYGGGLSLILLDIDNFKQFNDTFGHPAGDAVLKRVAAVLQACGRPKDVIARYGGEEFALLLPNMEKHSAMRFADRLREAIETNEWPHRAVTISIGVATLDDEVADVSALIQLADVALYKSKHGGRNRVTHASESDLGSAMAL